MDKKINYETQKVYRKTAYVFRELAGVVLVVNATKKWLREWMST